MVSYDCEICQGRGTIRLPVYRRVVAAFDLSTCPAVDESSRQYPCPECSEAVPFARIGVVGAIKEVDERITDPAYLDHVRHAAAHCLMDEIIKGGYLKVETAPPDTRDMRRAFRVSLGVVSQKQVASLEERIAKRQIEVAHEVVAEAEYQINNWGSYYGHSDILKRDATRMVRESIQAVVAKRAAWKTE